MFVNTIKYNGEKTKMDMKNIQRKERNKLFTVVLTMRITKEDSEFLREKNISPQGLFRESISDLKKKV